MPLTEGELHADVKVHDANFVDRDGCDVPHGYSGKLSMGVGGINSCVISRRWDEAFIEEHLAEPAKRSNPVILSRRRTVEGPPNW